mmetsp:Transcript_27326/g.72405  ORF Transcript_27326/g.72405 Transcript_27326/m.72405 type:complete len:245 (+) Transcript_27326:2264-2998(+)
MRCHPVAVRDRHRVRESAHAEAPCGIQPDQQPAPAARHHLHQRGLPVVRAGRAHLDQRPREGSGHQGPGLHHADRELHGEVPLRLRDRLRQQVRSAAGHRGVAVDALHAPAPDAPILGVVGEPVGPQPEAVRLLVPILGEGVVQIRVVGARPSPHRHTRPAWNVPDALQRSIFEQGDVGRVAFQGGAVGLQAALALLLVRKHVKRTNPAQATRPQALVPVRVHLKLYESCLVQQWQGSPHDLQT